MGGGEQGVSLLVVQAILQLQTYISVYMAGGETSKALSLSAAHWVRGEESAMMTWSGSPHPCT